MAWVQTVTRSIEFELTDSSNRLMSSASRPRNPHANIHLRKLAEEGLQFPRPERRFNEAKFTRFR
ncbi:hypothetical protein EYF80_004866 [Liparis tanakae]|uniref:Uncharacterized protein n=1 Tax=Liparis tanakae TaxID=230148 RepID=A0A4Z2J4F0_9TELE|nr:hypothetical protein EYF80_004866 [Liparis tanakae]